jgi:cbb3-type cytochrome oxidase maturation protein
MSVVFIALPVALALGGGALLACIWAIRRGQFDDLQSPAVRILLDDPPAAERGPALPATGPDAARGLPPAASGNPLSPS